jgi:hypothetical protein
LSLRIGDTTVQRGFPLSTDEASDPAPVSSREPSEYTHIYTDTEGTRVAFGGAEERIFCARGRSVAYVVVVEEEEDGRR